MTTQEMLDWINNATYEELFRKWRFHPVGSPFFQDDVGKYYAKVFAERRKEVGDAEHTRISKKIGWSESNYEAICKAAAEFTPEDFEGFDEALEEARHGERNRIKELEAEIAQLKKDNEASRVLKIEVDDYDPGLLNDFGGGNVQWWQDYIRAEIGEANERWQEQVSLHHLNWCKEQARLHKIITALEGRERGLQAACEQAAEACHKDNNTGDLCIDDGCLLHALGFCSHHK